MSSASWFRLLATPAAHQPRKARRSVDWVKKHFGAKLRQVTIAPLSDAETEGAASTCLPRRLFARGSKSVSATTTASSQASSSPGEVDPAVQSDPAAAKRPGEEHNGPTASLPPPVNLNDTYPQYPQTQPDHLQSLESASMHSTLDPRAPVFAASRLYVTQTRSQTPDGSLWQAPPPAASFGDAFGGVSIGTPHDTHPYMYSAYTGPFSRSNSLHSRAPPFVPSSAGGLILFDFARRARQLAVVKRSPDYNVYVAHRPKELRDDNDPVTPRVDSDTFPLDLQMWKRSVHLRASGIVLMNMVKKGLSTQEAATEPTFVRLPCDLPAAPVAVPTAVVPTAVVPTAVVPTAVAASPDAGTSAT